MTAIRTAAVIGGGIAGPVAAMALRRAGIEATVYEAYDSRADGIGGALSIAPNGQDALAAIGLDEVLDPISQPITSMVMRSGTGKRLGSFSSPEGLADMRMVWRPDLYRALSNAARDRGVTVEYGKRLIDAEEGVDSVTARFDDGTTTTVDLLVGADGIRSTVRRLIDGDSPEARYSGLLGFGARLDSTSVPSTNGEMHMVFGKRAFFGYQVNDDGTAGWFTNLPSKEPMTARQAREVGAEEWMRRLREVHSPDRVPAVELLDATDPSDLVITGSIEDIPSVPVWSSARMVLIGDAAHPTSPSSGQGASLASESAVQLARCLRDLPLDAALSAYERLRRERAEAIIAAAARVNSDKAAGPIARIARDLIMPLVMRMAGGKRSWEFEHHIDWDATVTGDQPVSAGAR